MATNSVKKLSLSKESAQFLLEGLKYFKENPQAKAWQGLEKNTFLLLARDIAQFYPNEEENFAEYLTRFESFLQRLINNEELAPSVPQNLKELVDALEAFQKEKDAKIKAKEIDIPTSQDITLEDWIKGLQEKHISQRIEKEIEKEAVFPNLPEQQKEKIKKNLTEKLAAAIPKTVIPSQEEKKQTAKEINHIINQGTASLILKNKDSLGQAIAQKTRFLTVPPVTTKSQLHPEEENLIKAVTQAIKNQTPLKNPDQIQKTAQEIAQGLAQKVPKLTAQEKATLTEIEKISLTEEVINASLPEITQTIQAGEVFLSLDPQESQKFLQELTNQTKQPLLDFAVSLREELEATSSNLPQAKNNQEGAVFNQLKKNPLLPYQLTPQENQIPLGLQMRQVVEHYGLNPKSAEIISYQNEEVAGLTNSITGKTSPWWQNQINRLRALGEDKSTIDQAIKNFNLQTRFETNFTQLAGFYQRAISWQGNRDGLGKLLDPLLIFSKKKLVAGGKAPLLPKVLPKGPNQRLAFSLKKPLALLVFLRPEPKKPFRKELKRVPLRQSVG